MRKRVDDLRAGDRIRLGSTESVVRAVEQRRTMLGRSWVVFREPDGRLEASFPDPEDTVEVVEV